MIKSFPSKAIAIVIVAGVLASACGGSPTQIPPPTLASDTEPTQEPSPISAPSATPFRDSPSVPTPQATETQTPPALEELQLERAFEALSFSRLTNLIQAGDRFFVTEQAGRVMTFPTGQKSPGSSVFLDLRDRVSDAGNEEGLLGLAFDPEFESNGHFYVYYSASAPRRSVVSRFTASLAGAATASPESELVIMEIPQPFSNHNGGQLAFGPDGMLYISLGDGGSGGDPQGNGQNTSALLGSILRIDVSGAGSESAAYRVPFGNPFIDADDGSRGEIWAYGFRNPWRFSFDRQNGDLWAGDVGQNAYEEVDVVVPGGNYGWNVLEGAHCYLPRSGCDSTGMNLPVIEYGANEGCSVIGGYVYRGTGIPSLAGTYLYGDYCSGELRGFRFENGEVVDHELLVDSGLMITSFGEDQGGEIYVLSQDGGIYRLTQTAR